MRTPKFPPWWWVIVVNLALWIAIAFVVFVAVHFIVKYW